MGQDLLSDAGGGHGSGWGVLRLESVDELLRQGGGVGVEDLFALGGGHGWGVVVGGAAGVRGLCDERRELRQQLIYYRHSESQHPC